MLIICFIPVGIRGFVFICTKAACDKQGNPCIIMSKMEHVEACLILMGKCCVNQKALLAEPSRKGSTPVWVRSIISRHQEEGL